MERLNFTQILILSCVVIACLMCLNGVSAFKAKDSACCLPSVHSYKATFYQKSYEQPPVPPQPGNGSNPQPQPGNGTVSPQPEPKLEPIVQQEPDRITVQYSLDLINMRKAELTIVESNNTQIIYKTIRFRTKDSLNYEYRIKSGKCSCSQLKYYTWKNVCITSSNTIPFTIGKNTGFISMEELYGGKVEITTLKTPEMRKGTCWITSKTMFLEQSVQDYKYYDMIEYVQEKDFEIPSTWYLSTIGCLL